MERSFSEKCYDVLKLIPKGKVTTYKEIAKAVKSPNSSRAVGNAMKKNPNAPIVPCHRVLKSNGDVGGYLGGTKKKIKMLQAEGIVVKNNKVDMEKFGYKF